MFIIVFSSGLVGDFSLLIVITVNVFRGVVGFYHAIINLITTVGGECQL